MIKINCQKVITEFVDTESGEIFTEERVLGEETKKTKSTRTRKPKDDGDPNPKVTLLEGKVQLNNAAVALTGWEPEMKIDIQFEKKGRNTCPVMMQKDSGNRLTKTYTISCRGSKHDNLAGYGDTFEVVPYDGKDGYFKLIGNAPKAEDDIIDIPEEITNPEEFDIENDDSGVDIGDFELEI